MNASFHISLPCRDIERTRSFYTEVLGASMGRSSSNWLDVDLFGHQMTFTKGKKFNFNYPHYNFEGQILPSFHFGVILREQEWNSLYQKLTETQGRSIEKGIFLMDRSGEHQSFFVKDPDDYTIEFKCFRNPEEMFRG